VKSQLLRRKFADVLNEELAKPGSGVDTPDSEYQYTNPFANKRNEENAVVAAIQIHEETKCLPPREGERVHHDSEAQAEIDIEKEKDETAKIGKLKTAEPSAQEWVALAKSLTSTEARYLKLVQRKSGQDPIQNIFPFSGAHNVRQFLQAINAMGHKGWFQVKDDKLFKTDTTDRLVETYDALRSGAVVASLRWKSVLLW
jgi:hypothetical protein